MTGSANKAVPIHVPAEDREDGDGQNGSKISFCSGQDDISVREQQYSQSSMNSEDARGLVSEHNILNVLDTSHRAGLGWVKDFLCAHLNEEVTLTETQLRNLMSRKRKSHPDDLFAWYKCESKSSAYVIKAAWRNYFLAYRVRILDMLERTLDPSGRPNEQHVSFLINFSELVKRAESEGVFDKNCRTGIGRWQLYWESRRPKRQVNPKFDISKRNLVNHLPPNYAEAIAEKMAYDPAIDLLTLTGLRPSEIPTVSLALDEFGILQIDIQTSKTKKDQAARYRRITVDPAHPSAIRLSAAVDEIDFRKFKNEPFRMKLGRITKALFGVRVSARCFRHDFAATMKQIDSADGTLTSKAMGHGATRSTCGYGNVSGKRRGSGKSKPSPVLAVSSSENVRETRSSAYRVTNKPGDQRATNKELMVAKSRGRN